LGLVIPTDYFCAKAGFPGIERKFCTWNAQAAVFQSSGAGTVVFGVI
jgi:hypothetical protein